MAAQGRIVSARGVMIRTGPNRPDLISGGVSV
jgi:hypothetical protein